MKKYTLKLFILILLISLSPIAIGASSEDYYLYFEEDFSTDEQKDYYFGECELPRYSGEKWEICGRDEGTETYRTYLSQPISENYIYNLFKFKFDWEYEDKYEYDVFINLIPNGDDCTVRIDNYNNDGSAIFLNEIGNYHIKQTLGRGDLQAEVTYPNGSLVEYSTIMSYTPMGGELRFGTRGTECDMLDVRLDNFRLYKYKESTEGRLHALESTVTELVKRVRVLWDEVFGKWNVHPVNKNVTEQKKLLFNETYINFQPEGAEIPEGYTPDYGKTYNSNRSFGWSRDLTIETRDRDINLDQRLDTLINIGEEPATFRADLEDGIYEVTVSVGDPLFPQGTHNVVINSVPFIVNQTTGPNEFLTVTKEIEITNNRLEMEAWSSEPHPDPGVAVTLNYLDVIPKYQEYVPDEHTTGLWHFNEGEGTKVYDEITLQWGNVNGASWRDGLFNLDKAIYFDGEDDMIEMTMNGELYSEYALTLEAWINIESIKRAKIIEKDKPYYLSIEDGKLEGGVNIWDDGPNWKYARGSTNLETGVWYHVAMVYDGSEVKVYLNGVEDGATLASGPFIDQSNRWYVGAGVPGGFPRYFHGTIDEVRISNIARDPSEFNV